VLDAGIDVLSTMNVQHVESLNDVIAQITRVQVRETVPDSVLDRADAIELIDIAPEELLQRLHDGKVYLPEQAKRATQHFFQRGNLLALRELALRRTAQHVDDDVLAYREEHGVAATWPAGERILVCVGPAPSSGRLIRAAARMASGLRCPWVAAYVEPTTSRPMSDADLERLEGHLRLAESLGASNARLSGATVAEAVLHHARKQNVTRIIVGKPTHSRLRDRLRGSLLDEIVRGSGDIDVHVIRGDSERNGAERNADAAKRRTPPWQYASAVVLVALTLGASLALRELVDLPDPEMLFLLTVMVTAVWFGRAPSQLAAALGVASYDFFFVPPFHTFTVDDRRYFLTFAMMFGVGFVMSELAGRLRRQEREARAREERTAALYALTRELASSGEPVDIAGVAARHASEVLSANAAVLVPTPSGELGALGVATNSGLLDDKTLGVAKWSHEHGALAGFGTDTLPGSKTLCAPLRAGGSRLGVLAIMPQSEGALSAEQRDFLDVFSRQIAAALERTRLADEAKQAALRANDEAMRSSLLSAVSHDLRTPLASITGAATSLRDDSELGEETRRELIESIVDQAERLERLVANLLDMTRLEFGGVAPKREWVPLEEMIGSALTRLESRLGSREVRVGIDADVPLVSVDPVLFEQVFVNLLENADKYTSKASPIELVARQVGVNVEIEVSDRGEGLPKGDEARLFEKFHRGSHEGVSGAGLGLPICKGIVEVHGGTIVAENRPGGGATFRITLPIAGTPPSLKPPECAP
jgi:two-component system, OmpR family, sensor histidine kinase KdpD